MEAPVHRLLIAGMVVAGLSSHAHAGNLYLACAGVLPEKRELFLQAALRSPVDHGDVSNVNATACTLLVPSARAKLVPMKPTAGKDSFMDKKTIESAMQRSYPK
jgi:hypothetical protein